MPGRGAFLWWSDCSDRSSSHPKGSDAQLHARPDSGTASRFRPCHVGESPTHVQAKGQAYTLQCDVVWS